MGGKQMEGDNRQRRKQAKEARDHGQKASEVGATTGSSKQVNSPKSEGSHQEKLDLKREGKQDDLTQGHPPEAGTRSRDEHGPERDRYPRLNEDE